MAWGISSSKYVQEACSASIKHHKEHHGSMHVSKKPTSPFPSDYRPELDVSAELNDSDANYYQSLIGILRWSVELGRIDVITEVSILASHVALPREGHLAVAYRV